MEKKNTVLLTVIAVATLLVAVVGATFAYFTATTNSGTGNGTTSTTTTTQMASSSIDMSEVSKTNDSKADYPGGMLVAGAMVTASTTDTDATRTYDMSYTVNFTVDASQLVANGSKITYTVYEVGSEATGDLVTGCTLSEGTVDATTKSYWYSGCTANKTITDGTPVNGHNAQVIAKGTNANNLSFTDTLTGVKSGSDQKTYYYIVATYDNDTAADQNADFGATINISFDSVTGGTATLQSATTN